MLLYSTCKHAGRPCIHIKPPLQLLLPGTTLNVINLGRGSTTAMPAAMCWYDYVPATADLVIVEYSANGCLRLQW
jgi:hypothetical protein